MTTNVKLFKSTNVGAPALTGQAGSLIALLDAILVNGYNAGSVTSITRSGSTATATRAGHGFQIGDCILNEGVDQAEYNGEFYITAVTADTYQFTVSGTPVSPATGVLTSKKAPLGWTKSYSGTNKAVYRQLGGNLMYLRVDDAGTSTARVVGYESMVDVDTGTNPFPAGTQISGGLYWSKSSTTDATARPWLLVGNDRLFYHQINPNSDGTASSSMVFSFGDIKSYKVGDAFGTWIVGGTSASVTSNNLLHHLVNSIASPSAGHFLGRSFTQAGSSLNFGKHSDYVKGQTASAMGSSGMSYPSGPDSSLYLSPVWVHEPTGPHLRGEAVGLWNPLHARPLSNWDTFEGAAGSVLAGKKFIAVNMYTSAQAFLEISNTWSF